MDKAILYWELWSFEKKLSRLPKTKKLYFIMAKSMVIFQNYFLVFEQNSFRNLIYNGKTMVLRYYRKKLWYYEKNYNTIPKTMELWITIENNYSTIVKYKVFFC